MAPERILGKPYTIRSDVWSTGLTLLELAQRRFPYPQNLGPIDLITLIVRAEPPHLEDDQDTSWSDLIKEFLLVSLTVDADKRPTPKEMLEHPFMLKTMTQRPKMDKWIAELWGFTPTSTSAPATTA